MIYFLLYLLGSFIGGSFLGSYLKKRRQSDEIERYKRTVDFLRKEAYQTKARESGESIGLCH